MIETAKMSDRGQIIIPKDIRDEIGASTDTLFIVSTLDDKTIVMKKMDTTALVNEFRRLRDKTKKAPPKKVEGEIRAARKK